MIVRRALSVLVPTIAAALVLATTAGAAPQGRIINGTQIDGVRKSAMWPFLVSLGTTGETPSDGHYCGGSLIAPRLVLTAAHCVDSWDETEKVSVRTIPSTLSVFAGSVSLRGRGQRRAALDIFVHPKWNPATFANDLAIVRLKTPVQLGATVAATQVVAPAEDAWWGNGAGVTESAERGPWAAGWGNLKPYDSGELFPDVLNEVAFPVASDAACASEDYPGIGWLDTNIDMSLFLCAGRPDSDDQAANGTTSADTCQGDSGGPLVIGDGLGAWRIFALVSHGDSCGGPAYGAYTRLATYRSWIASVAAGANGPGGIRPIRAPRLTARSSSAVTAAWTAPLGGAASYVVYYEADDIGDGGLVRYGVTKGRSMRFTGLDSASSYDIYVAARNRSGNEAPMRRIVLRTR